MKTPKEVLLRQRRHIEPKLNRIWYETLVPRLGGNVLWRELIWPCRRIWAGLACAWALIVILNVASSEPTPRLVGKAKPQSREEIQALVQQRQLLAQMMESQSEPNEKREPNPLGPRSERARRALVA